MKEGRGCSGSSLCVGVVIPYVVRGVCRFDYVGLGGLEFLLGRSRSVLIRFRCRLLCRVSFRLALLTHLIFPWGWDCFLGVLCPWVPSCLLRSGVGLGGCVLGFRRFWLFLCRFFCRLFGFVFHLVLRSPWRRFSRGQGRTLGDLFPLGPLSTRWGGVRGCKAGEAYLKRLR